MKVEEIRSLFEYNRWANRRFFEVIAALPDDQIMAHVESSFPSILYTFAHIVGAEWVWLRRWKGENPSTLPDWLVNASLEKLRTQLSEVESEREVFAGSLRDEDLQQVLDYRTLDGTAYRNRLEDLLVHVVNHSTYHRGQLTTMLRQLGVRPVATDFVLFKREAAGRES